MIGGQMGYRPVTTVGIRLSGRPSSWPRGSLRIQFRLWQEWRLGPVFLSKVRFRARISVACAIDTKNRFWEIMLQMLTTAVTGTALIIRYHMFA
jgi:hypothetical protein